MMLSSSSAYDGTIRLNRRVVMPEPSLIDYTVFHELTHLEMIDRHHRVADRSIKAARVPATKSLHPVSEQASGLAARTLRVT